MVRGEEVIVRALEDIALIRRVWDVGEKVVYITDNEGFSVLSAGLESSQIIGFPIEDVFQYLSGIVEGAVPNWTAMERWKDSQPATHSPSAKRSTGSQPRPR